MPSDAKRLHQAMNHIDRIKQGSYPQIVSDGGYFRIAERPWAQIPEPNKLAILQTAVNWEGITNRDQGHILLSNIDPGKITDAQRDKLVRLADGPELKRTAEVER
jgi:hypothetical protein